MRRGWRLGSSCPWKKSSMHLWMEESPLGRPVEKPRFPTVDGHRIQRCCTLSTAC